MLAQKPLTKTRTLGPKYSSKKPSSTADAHIFCANRLLLTDKPLRNWVPGVPKFILQNAFLRLTLRSSMYIDYCWFRNCWRKLGPSDPKNHRRSPVLRLTLTCSAQINYSWQTNRWWKLSPWCPKNHPRNPVLPLTLNLQSTQTTAASETVDEN